MAININLLSINVDKLHTWFKYGDMLVELADKVDIFRQNFRTTLIQNQRNELKDFAGELRDKTFEISTIKTFNLLAILDSELMQLKQAVCQTDQLLNDIINTKKIMLRLADILDLVAKILAIANLDEA